MIKIIWAILFLAALGITIYFLYNTINEYLEYNVTTEVRSINVDELVFPVITICNANQISNEKGLDYFISILKESGYDFDLEGLLNHIDSTQYNHFLDFGDSFPSLNFYRIPIKERINYSSTIDDMFVDGVINDRVIYAEDFNWIFTPYMGNCYQLNTNSDFKVKSYQDNILELNFHLTLPYIVEKYGYKNSLDLFISDKKSNPFKFFYDKAIRVPTGVKAKLNINKSLYK